MSALSLDARLDRAAKSLSRLEGAGAHRRDALRRFQTHGFPSRKDERWRYTELKTLRDADLDFDLPPPDNARIEAATAMIESLSWLNPAALRCVMMDGHFVPSLSRTDNADGIRVEYGPDIRDDAAEPANAKLTTRHWLAELNTAFAPGALQLTLQAGSDRKGAPPLELIVLASQSQAASQCRISIELGAGAELAIMQFVGSLPATDSSWLNQVIELRQGPESRFELTRLQQAATSLSLTTLYKAVLARDAVFESGGIDLGGRLTRNDFDLLLDEPGAEATLFGLAFARDAQHMDNQIAIDHKAAQTTSRQVFRNIVGDRSRGVFNGKIVVRPGAQKIDAQQSSDNLLLADRAEIDTKPEFEIYADDVKCSHGATIGEIDDDQLFYLQSRGIDEATARSLLTFAFANVIVDRIRDSALREHVARYITQQLPDDPGLELVAQ